MSSARPLLNGRAAGEVPGLLEHCPGRAPVLAVLGEVDRAAREWRAAEPSWRAAGVDLTVRIARMRGYREWLFEGAQAQALLRWLEGLDAPGSHRAAHAAKAGEGALQAQMRGHVPGGTLSQLPPERAGIAARERADCAARGPSHCARRAEQYEQGTGTVPIDAGLAAALLEQACVLEHWQSCARLGLVYAEGAGMGVDAERSAQLYWLACANGPIPAACVNLGLQYAEGVGVPQSEPIAESYFERACQGRNTLGCKNLEALRQARRERALAPERAAQVPNASFRALPPDKAARIRPELLQCFDAYSRTHCNNLGVDYARGLEVARDEALAAALFEQACHLGEATACTNLTNAALAAQRRARPLASADKVLSEACEAGQAVACSELGAQALVSARPEDDARALRLLGRACSAGNAMACTNLGWMHERGRGAPADLRRAGELYSVGCAAGVSLACRNQAVLQSTSAPAAPAPRRAASSRGT